MCFIFLRKKLIWLHKYGVGNDYLLFKYRKVVVLIKFKAKLAHGIN